MSFHGNELSQLAAQGKITPPEWDGLWDLLWPEIRCMSTDDDDEDVPEARRDAVPWKTRDMPWRTPRATQMLRDLDQRINQTRMKGFSRHKPLHEARPSSKRSGSISSSLGDFLHAEPERAWIFSAETLSQLIQDQHDLKEPWQPKPYEQPAHVTNFIQRARPQQQEYGTRFHTSVSHCGSCACVCP